MLGSNIVTFYFHGRNQNRQHTVKVCRRPALFKIDHIRASKHQVIVPGGEGRGCAVVVGPRSATGHTGRVNVGIEPFVPAGSSEGQHGVVRAAHERGGPRGIIDQVCISIHIAGICRINGHTFPVAGIVGSCQSGSCLALIGVVIGAKRGASRCEGAYHNEGYKQKHFFHADYRFNGER